MRARSRTNGRIIERGTHAELLELGGLYRSYLDVSSVRAFSPGSHARLTGS
jgi:ABC-type multidrug transport system fused ATPase/permease subunit